jgi:hypothetical protein
MEQYPIPKGIYELVDIFCTWCVQLSKPYERFTLKLPGCFLFPFSDRYDLADLEACRDLMRTNWGNMLTHSKKFGLKLGKWRNPIKPTIKTLKDPDVIAFFAHAHLKFYDNQPAEVELGPNGGHTGSNLTTDYTSHEYMFLEDPNESLINVLAPWFGTYDGTNNPYGGFIKEMTVSTTEYSITILSVSQHGNDITPLKFSDDLLARFTIQLHKCCIDNFVQDGGFNTAVIGDNWTATQGLDDSWVIDVVNQLYMGSGRGATETNNDLLNYIGRLLV